jgi:hypothetical protein
MITDVLTRKRLSSKTLAMPLYYIMQKTTNTVSIRISVSEERILRKQFELGEGEREGEGKRRIRITIG